MDEIFGANLNQETGLLTWQEKLASAQSVTKDVIYQVKYPKGKQIPSFE